jgi:hypothetical protein
MNECSLHLRHAPLKKKLSSFFIHKARIEKEVPHLTYIEHNKQFPSFFFFSFLYAVRSQPLTTVPAACLVGGHGRGRSAICRRLRQVFAGTHDRRRRQHHPPSGQAHLLWVVSAAAAAHRRLTGLGRRRRMMVGRIRGLATRLQKKNSKVRG